MIWLLFVLLGGVNVLCLLFVSYCVLLCGLCCVLFCLRVRMCLRGLAVIECVTLNGSCLACVCCACVCECVRRALMCLWILFVIYYVVLYGVCFLRVVLCLCVCVL